MSNTLVRLEKATGYFFNDPVSEDAEMMRIILSSPDRLICSNRKVTLIRTAISGSGPAYVFEFTSALEDAQKRLA